MLTRISGPSGTINYLLKPNAERLPLIAGDGDTFTDILELMTEYEGTCVQCSCVRDLS
jgi:hypothetical protein